jgi:O-antigen ligase
LFARYSLAKILCVVVLGLHWYILIMTGARGSTLALVAAIVFAVAILPAVRKSLMQWQMAGLVLGVLIFGGVLLSFQHGTNEAGDNVPTVEARQGAGLYGNENQATTSFLAQSVGRPLLDPAGRTWMWKITLDDARANPLLGIGPMNYVCTSPHYIGHPHSFPLQLAAEWGIPVALAACLVFAALLLQGTAGLRRQRANIGAATVLPGLLLTGVLAAALTACVSGVMVTPASQVAGLVVCGLLLGFAPGSPVVTTPTAGRFAYITGVILAIALLALGAQELRTMPGRSAQMRPGEDLWPRIWQDAKVCRLYVPQNEVTK